MKTPTEAFQLSELLSKNNQRLGDSSSGSRSPGRYDVNKMLVLEANIDDMMRKMDDFARKLAIASVETIDERLPPEMSYVVEDVQFIGGNNSKSFRPDINIPTHYHLDLRNHIIFSYENQH